MLLRQHIEAHRENPRSSLAAGGNGLEYHDVDVLDDNECGQSDSDRIHKLEDFKKKIIAQAFVHSPCDSAKLRKIVDTAMQVQQRHLYDKPL